MEQSITSSNTQYSLQKTLHKVSIAEYYQNENLTQTLNIVKQGLKEIFGDISLYMKDDLCENYTINQLGDYLLRWEYFINMKSSKPISFGKYFIDTKELRNYWNFNYVIMYNSFGNIFFTEEMIGYFEKKYGSIEGPKYFQLLAQTHYHALQQYKIHQDRCLKELEKHDVIAISR